MKTLFIYLSLIFLIAPLASCTPTTELQEKNEYKAPPSYGTGGEHSSEPDNEKDWNTYYPDKEKSLSK